MADMQDAIRELQETAIVMSGIQARQAEVLKGQGLWLEQHEKRMQRLETNLAEAGEKLNALTSVVDDLGRRDEGQKR
jgi:hypothetical protein